LIVGNWARASVISASGRPIGHRWGSHQKKSGKAANRRYLSSQTLKGTPVVGRGSVAVVTVTLVPVVFVTVPGTHALSNEEISIIVAATAMPGLKLIISMFYLPLNSTANNALTLKKRSKQSWVK
jgi:hypothetical protein